jgi:dimethylaniline monooxygenase (N-oxide forming)
LIPFVLKGESTTFSSSHLPTLQLPWPGGCFRLTICRLFWQNGTGGLLNRADFWETIAPNVRIYHDDVLELDKRLVRLKGGDEVPTDILLCGTGWHGSSFGFFDPELVVKLGLPHPFSDEPAEDADAWTQLEKQADQRVLEQFPQLAHPPDHPHKPVKTTPYRLYNGIAPLGDDSIAFVGYAICSNYFKGVECQAIWATAYLDKQLTLPCKDDQRAEIARLTAWCRRRYLSNGERGNFLPFESIGYMDKLLREIGLSSHRKGWFRDYFVPGTSQDFVGLKDEYAVKYGYDQNKSGKQKPELSPP